jgi:hypothetical protein
VPPTPFRHRRNEILFYTLLVTLLLAPVVARSELGAVTLQAILGLNILLALVRGAGRRFERTLLVIAGILIALRITGGLLDIPRLEGFALTVLAGVALLAAARTVRYAMEGATVDSEHVFAALSAYMLAGIFCGVMYWQMDQLAPGSIQAASGGALPLQGAIYFSFMTLATVGFGDIVPKSDLARGLVTLEAVAGQLYVAVMIARLLTLYSGRRSRA